MGPTRKYKLFFFVAMSVFFIPEISRSQTSVYKCVLEDGSTTFSDTPCAEHAEVYEVRETYKSDFPALRAPRVMASPSHEEPKLPTDVPPTGNKPETKTQEAISYQCSALSGEIWYQHSPCPQRITGRQVSPVSGIEANTGKPIAGVVLSDKEFAVEEQIVSRERACREIYRHATSNRSGAERDERYSTYDRNLGRDPCR